MLIVVNPSINLDLNNQKFFIFQKISILNEDKKNCLFNNKLFMVIDGYVTDKNDKILSKEFIFTKFCDFKTNSNFLDLVKTFGGAFGIFLYDVRKEKTYFFKDEDGYRPFFYKRIKETLIISNNIKQFKTIIKLSVNNNFLKKYIVFRYNYLYGSKNFFFKSIFYLPAASYIFFYKNSFKVFKYSNYNLNINSDLSFDQAKEKVFKEILRLFKIKKNQFNSKSILALSGGMDSTSTAYFIYKATGKKIDSFTASYNLKKSSIDEVLEAQKVGKKFSKKWFKIKINSSDFLKTWKNIYNRHSIPLPTGSSLGFDIMYSKASKMGYKKIINSGNPDHYFFGNYPAYLYNLSDLFFSKKKEFRAELQSWINNHSTKNFPKSKKLFYSFYNNNILKKKLFTIRPQIEILGQKYLNSYRGKTYSRSFTSNSFLNAYLKMSLWQSERPPGIVSFYEMSNQLMVSSIDPFIGERLKKLTYSLPANYKIHMGSQKVIFRKIMKNYLPESIINNKNKIGFDLPFLYWINHDSKIKKYVIDLLLKAKTNKFYNFININKIIKDLKKKIFRDHMFLWQLINAIMWKKNNSK